MGNGEKIKDLYDAFGRGDVAAVLGAMSPDISWTEAEGFMYGGKYHGPESVLHNVFMKLATEWEGFSVHLSDIVDGGDKVVGLGNYSGKYLKTGKSVTVQFAHVWTFKDGKIAEFVQHTDTLVIAKTLGV